MTTRSKIALSDLCYLDIERGVLYKSGLSYPFSKSQTLILQCLAQSIGHPTPKITLTKYIWGEASESVDRLLYQNIHRIRHKLEDDAHNPQYLITVKGFGYMLNHSK
ncbi:hypothetical protein AAC03nite_39470 [Alicyclobacillus acidoterrestris]|nr:hypothetical protein AAC03nite_39470 [Alicyclobacillus acidoterrestris]